MRSIVLLVRLSCAGKKRDHPDFRARFLSYLADPASDGNSPRDPARFDARQGAEEVHGEIYRCNLRISALGRRGDIDRARALFDQMPKRDVVTYTSMIDLYLKNGDILQAEALFRASPERNVVTESAMIHGLATAGRMDEARRLFDEMPVRNVYTWTILLSAYCQSGDVRSARGVFDEMPEKNVVSWISMVLGYAQNGLLSDARILFDQMPERNTVAWTAMIKAYVDDGEIIEAGNLFENMPQRNLYSWNIMIKGYFNCKQVCKAICLFESMPQKNIVSWTTMISGLGDNGMIDRARNMFDQMPVRDIAAWNAMLTAYANNRQMDMASEFFNSMQRWNIVSWNALIDGYAKNGSQAEAMSVFLCMLRSSIKPNAASLTSLLWICDSILAGMEVHAIAAKLAIVPDTCFANALVSMYSKNGDLGSAWLAFDALKAKDVVSWTSMILAFANHGCGCFALKVFAKMLGCGAQPDAVTFIGLLSACSHNGFVEKGIKLFGSMRRAYGVEPMAEHYSCLVDILGRAGRVDEAILVLNQVPHRERDAAVLGAMLGACKVRGEVEIASRIVDDLSKLEPASAGTFVALANIYASKGEWTDVARVRMMMREQRVEKVPGFSQIDVKMRSHVFFAADRAHSECDEIYTMLEELLLPQMKGMECKQEL